MGDTAREVAGVVQAAIESHHEMMWGNADFEWEAIAASVLSALDAAGLVVVPRVPTAAMVEAFAVAYYDTDDYFMDNDRAAIRNGLVAAALSAGDEQ